MREGGVECSMMGFGGCTWREFFMQPVDGGDEEGGKGLAPCVRGWHGVLAPVRPQSEEVHRGQ